MADTLNLLGVIGTWVAVLLAIIALAGIIPAYILYRESQTDHYEALSLIDDRTHEYISRGYALLPKKRFFRSIKVPNLIEPPRLVTATATATAPTASNSAQAIAKIARECDILDREGSPSLTSGVNFANLLRAYGISGSVPRDGKLRISGTEAILPVHRSWVLLLGLVDRYGLRDDSGLFVEEPSDPEWGAFGTEALYGLSGIIERVRPGRERICFRMHSVAHMRSMPDYIPEDISPRDLFFLYLGYLPAADGSLYCSAVEAESGDGSKDSSVFVHRSTNRNRDVFYQMKVLKPNEVPVRDRRLAEEMGITLPTIRRMSLYKSMETVEGGRAGTPDHAMGLLEDVQYDRLDGDGDTRIRLRPSDTQAMILALLQLDLNPQSFLCGDDLKGFLERLLPARDMDYFAHMAGGGIDKLPIQDVDKEQLKELVQMVISEYRSQQKSSTRGRGLAAALAKLDRHLRSVREKRHAPAKTMETMGILYLTEDEFRSRMAVDPHHIDPEALFSVNIAQKKVHVPAISYYPLLELDFNFSSVFATTTSETDEGGILTLPLWQAMLASLHGSVRWHMWSTVFSARDLSTMHTQLNRIVYISAQDLPDQQQDMGERLQDMANACREFTSLIRKARKESRGQNRRRGGRYDEEDGEDDDDDGDRYDDSKEKREYDDSDTGSSDEESQRSRSIERVPPRGRQWGNQVYTDHQGKPLQQEDFFRDNGPSFPQGRTPSPDVIPIAATPLLSDYEDGNNEGLNGLYEEPAGALTTGRVNLTREEREEGYLHGLKQLLATCPEGEEEKATLIQEFRDVIAPIVLLAEPLLEGSLVILLGVPEATILRQLDLLESAVLESVVSTAPVGVSFRDFLVDPDLPRKSDIWVDEVETHKGIGMKCLDLISQPGVLRENACNLGRPGHPRADIWGRTIEDIFPPHVQYACRYWVYHFEKGKCSLSDDGAVMAFLKDHFLHWLEALSLIGSIDESIVMINALRPLAAPNSQISLFLYDAWRFLLKNREAIDEAPLQLYSSALIFLPQSSVIRSTFQQHITGTICQVPVANHTWDPVLLSLGGHSNFIEALAFSPDGKMLVTGARNTATIWSAITGAVLETVKADEGVRGVAFSSDCSLLAIAGYRRFVTIYDLQKKREIWKFKAGSSFASDANAVVFSQDGKLLAAGASDGMITLWDIAKGALIHRFEGHPENVVALALSPKGLLASGSNDKTAKVWDVLSAQLLHTFEGFSTSVSMVDFSPDGSLVMASHDGTVKSWDAKDGVQPRTLISSGDHESQEYGLYVSPVVLSPDGKVLAMSVKNTVELWDTASGKKVAVVQGSLPSISALVFSPDSTTLAATNRREDKVEIWEVPGTTGRGLEPIIEEERGRVFKPMIFSPDGKVLASANWKTIDLWDPATAILNRTSEEFEMEINHLTFSQDNKVLAFVCGEWIKIWDLVGMNGVHSLDIGTWYGNVNQLAFSPDCTLIAEASFQTVRLWNITSGSVHQTFPVLDSVLSMAFSPDSSFLACSLSNGMIQRWSVAKGVPLPTLPGDTGVVVQLAFSSDSMILASASGDNTIALWDWDAGTALQVFEADTDITEMSFCDDNRRLKTNLEIFALEEFDDKRQPRKISSYPKFGLKDNWVTRDGENVLWLPWDYRAQSLRSHGKRVALELESGRVIFVAFSS